MANGRIAANIPDFDNRLMQTGTVSHISHTYLVHSTIPEVVGTFVGLEVEPFDIHIMKKSQPEEN